MAYDTHSAVIPMYHDVVVFPEPPGQFTAQVVGFPEVRATAATEPEAIQTVAQKFAEQLRNARWVRIRIPTPMEANRLFGFVGQKDPDDPLEQEYVEDLARMRREDLEHTLREQDQKCSASSSTPTT